MNNSYRLNIPLSTLLKMMITNHTRMTRDIDNTMDIRDTSMTMNASIKIDLKTGLLLPPMYQYQN